MSTLKENGKYAITMIFGENACKRYADGEKSKAILNEHGKCRAFEFSTLGELNAFLYGLEQASEWDDWECYEEDGI